MFQRKPFRTYSEIRVRETGSGPGSLMASHERPRSASVQTASPRQCQCRSSAIASRAVEAGGIGTPSRERRRAGRSCGEHEDDRHSTLAPTNEAGSVSIAASTTAGIGERGPMSALLTCERTTPTADIDGQHVHSLIGVTLPASRCWSGRAGRGATSHTAASSCPAVGLRRDDSRILTVPSGVVRQHR
jgi:hypothetical protein